MARWVWPLHECLCTAAAPRAPGLLRASVAGSSRVRVEWALLSPNEARGHVLSYTVTHSGAVEEIHTLPNQSSVVISGLMAGSTYSVYVWANTSAGEGERSSATVRLPAAIGQAGRGCG